MWGRPGGGEPVKTLDTSGRRPGSGGDQALPDGVTDQASDIVDVQLLHDTRAVKLGRLGADGEQGGGPFVRLALGHALHDLAFTSALPSDASATTSRPCRSSRARTPCRSTTWSSASTTRSDIVPPRVQSSSIRNDPARRQAARVTPNGKYPSGSGLSLLFTYAVGTFAPLQVALSLRPPVSQAAVVARARARRAGALPHARAAEPVRPGPRRGRARPRVRARGRVDRSPVLPVRQQGDGHARGPEP